MKKCILGSMVLWLTFWCVACGERVQVQEGLAQDIIEEERETLEASSQESTVLQENVAEKECLVQVRTETQRGSAVLLDRQEEAWIFVTAAHVVEGLEHAEVYFAEQEQSAIADVSCVEGLDLAFLQVDKEGLTEAVAFEYVECSISETQIAADAEILAVGYDAQTERIETAGTILESWIYVEDFENYMLLCACEAQAGMSGGGVFTQEGALAGIICGQNAEGMLAVLPAAVLVGEYENSFFNH